MDGRGSVGCEHRHLPVARQLVGRNQARERLRVGLTAPATQAADTSDIRAYALNAASRRLLEDLRAWPDPAHATLVKQYAQKALSHRMRHAERTLTHFRATPQGLEERALRRRRCRLCCPFPPAGAMVGWGGRVVWRLPRRRGGVR